MNVVISGPFGCGSLADEAVLAGLLCHLPRPRNTVTVLSADPAGTMRKHAVNAVEAGAPNTFLSNRKAWQALQQSQLFVLAGAGIISGSGAQSARAWLMQLEHAQVAGLKTALIAIGALPIEDPLERVRIQRLLHHHAEAISTRDAASKAALITCGMNANRISANGDCILALPTPALQSAPDSNATVALILSPRVPSREGYAFQPAAPDAALVEYVAGLVHAITATQKLHLKILHDDVPAAREWALNLSAGSHNEIETIGAGEPVEEIMQKMAACQSALSLSLHGGLLAAISGTPVLLPQNEPGAAELATALGSAEPLRIGDVDGALAALARIAADAARRKEQALRVVGLRKKEAQNGRILELLVPRRVARERNEAQKEGVEIGEGDSPPRRAPKRPAPPRQDDERAKRPRR